MPKIEKKQLKPKTYRYERKFLIEHITPAEVILAIKMHPAGFQPLFKPRTINNIYFDTPGFANYSDNIEGEFYRLKYRIRWYGELYGDIKKPVLEVKEKEGLLGAKHSYKLAPFALDRTFSRARFQEMLTQSDIPLYIKNELASLQPTLLNRYHRNYFLTFDKKFRVTVDDNLVYHRINFLNPVSLDRNKWTDTVVLELKYSDSTDEEARDVASMFPFQLTKSSKYYQGIARLYGGE